MSTGAILTVLSNIPWGQVVENAPKLADGAAKLWNSVVNFRKTTAPVELPNALHNHVQPSETEVLRVEVEHLQVSMKNFQQQMQDSSELIKALAEQNTQLVARIELNRVRMQRVAITGAVASALLSAAVIYLLLR